ncbi:MAG: STAS domain-containing protein [Planctomycetota bacterium]
MRIRCERIGSIAVLTMQGQLDPSTLPRLDERVEQHLNEGRSRLVLQLREVGAIDASALGFIARTQRRLRERGGELVVAEPSDAFLQAADDLGLDELFAIHTTTVDAIGHLRGETSTDIDGPHDLTTMLFHQREFPERIATARLVSHPGGPRFEYPSDGEDMPIDPGELRVGQHIWVRFRRPFREGGPHVHAECVIVWVKSSHGGLPGARLVQLRYVEDDADRGRSDL